MDHTNGLGGIYIADPNTAEVTRLVSDAPAPEPAPKAPAKAKADRSTPTVVEPLSDAS